MTGCCYIDWLEKAREIRRILKKGNPPEHNLFFYGHSLDITDTDILRRLILEEGLKTTIFKIKKSTKNQVDLQHAIYEISDAQRRREIETPIFYENLKRELR